MHTPSKSDLKELEILLSKPNLDFISIFELKHTIGIKGVVREIYNKRKSEIILNLKGENTEFLSLIFYAFSLITLKSSVQVISNEGVHRRSFLYLCCNALMLVSYYLKNCLLGLFANFQVGKLKNNIVELDMSKIKTIHYLKTNLWFGIKAGGSIGHISGVVNSLAKKYDVKYITCEQPIMINEEIVEILNINGTTAVRYSVPYELNQLQISNSFFKFIKNLKVKPECIYQRLTLYNFSGALYSRLFKIPFILEYNGSEVWIQQNWSKGLKYGQLAQKVENFCLFQASKIITVSRELEKDLIARGVEPSRIVYYPNCIDPEKYDNEKYSETCRKEYRDLIGVKESDIVFTFIGTFGVWHGVEFMANAIKKYLESGKAKNIKFLLIGGGVLFEKVKDILSDPVVRDFVIMTGVVPQKQAPLYLSASDCFLSPHVERAGEVFFGSPTKLFEYMAFKKPIIASALYQIEEVFNNPFRIGESDSVGNNDGVLFTPNNEDHFIEAIDLCFNLSREKRAGMGDLAYKLVMKNYTWENHVSKLYE